MEEKDIFEVDVGNALDGCVTSITVGALANHSLTGNCILSGGITVASNSCGTISINRDYVAVTCLGNVIDKYFEDRSYDFKESLKSIFKSKSYDEQLACLLNMFTSQSLEFFAGMEDSEIIRFITIAC